MKKAVQQVAHIGIIVKNMDEAIFSLSKFGFPCIERNIIERGMNVEVAHLKVGNVSLELIQPLPGKSGEFADWLAKKGEGVHHIALRVDNIEESVGILKESGVVRGGEKIGSGTRNSKTLWLSPDVFPPVLLHLASFTED